MTKVSLHDTVTAHRIDQDGVLHEVSGKVVSLFVGPTGRDMAQVKSGDSVHNVEMFAIGLDESGVEAYKAAEAEVEALSAEGNKKIQELASDYNARVDAVYSKMAESV